MRSLEECKAEIFRRSEEKIKKQKQQRTRILAVCLPLCLCVGALALWGGFGQDDSAVNKSAAPPENGLGLLLAPKEEAAENTVDCMAPELSASVPVISQYEFVQALFYYAMDAENPGELKGSSVTTTAGAFSFTLCAPDGTLVDYVLSEKVLYEETTGRSVTLTDAQLRELKQVLDIQEVVE